MGQEGWLDIHVVHITATQGAGFHVSPGLLCSQQALR